MRDETEKNLYVERLVKGRRIPFPRSQKNLSPDRRLGASETERVCELKYNSDLVVIQTSMEFSLKLAELAISFGHKVPSLTRLSNRKIQQLHDNRRFSRGIANLTFVHVSSNQLINYRQTGTFAFRCRNVGANCYLRTGLKQKLWSFKHPHDFHGNLFLRMMKIRLIVPLLLSSSSLSLS